MKISYDPNKNQRNIEERNLSFDEVYHFDFASALIQEDTRHPYPEKRLVALGFIGQRLYIVCFTPNADGIRVISFRKANKREVKRHEENTPN